MSAGIAVACNRQAQRRGGRGWITIGLMALVAVVAWFVIVTPALVGLGLAVAAAVLWCLWLERHPLGAVRHDG